MQQEMVNKVCITDFRCPFSPNLNPLDSSIWKPLEREPYPTNHPNLKLLKETIARA